MRKVLCAAAAALSLLALCSCAEQRPEQEPPETLEPEDFVLLDTRRLESFSADETERMINQMSANRALIVGDRLYTFDFDGDYQPVLACYTLEEGTPTAFQILAEDCVPAYLAELDGRLYYINRGAIESLEPDGGDRRTLREGPCTALQIWEGRLWFCDASGSLRRMEPDGGGETVILDGGCFYPWLSQGAVLYQSDSDGERLHLRWLEDGSDIALTVDAAYAPVVLDSQIWYTGKTGLCRLGLDGLDGESWPLPGLQGAAELLPGEGGWLLRGVTDENGPRTWTAPLDAPEKRETAAYGGYRLCDFTGGGYRVDAWYNPDGRVRSFILVSPDGSETELLAGRADGRELPGPAAEN